MLAATDFTIFSASMVKRNIMIQEQVLAMILASTGALPTCLTREAPTAAGADRLHNQKSPSYVIIGGMDDKEEKELMQLVMQYVVIQYFYCSCNALLLYVSGEFLFVVILSSSRLAWATGRASGL